jgi:hypothetical protein
MVHTFLSLIAARNPVGLEIFLDAGYNPSHLEYHQILIDYDHQVEECREIIRVISSHPTTRNRYFSFIMNFAQFHLLHTVMEGVERIQSDTDLNNFIFRAIPQIRDGVRQFILLNNHHKVSHDDYPIVQIVDRLLRSKRIDLSNPPENVLKCIMTEPNLGVYNLYARSHYRPQNYDIQAIVNANNEPILNYVLTVININTQNKDGETALIFILKRGKQYYDQYMINRLLMLGADPSIVDNTGHDANYYAGLNNFSLIINKA